MILALLLAQVARGVAHMAHHHQGWGHLWRGHMAEGVVGVRGAQEGHRGMAGAAGGPGAGHTTGVTMQGPPGVLGRPTAGCVSFSTRCVAAARVTGVTSATQSQAVIPMCERAARLACKRAAAVQFVDV